MTICKLNVQQRQKADNEWVVSVVSGCSQQQRSEAKQKLLICLSKEVVV